MKEKEVAGLVGRRTMRRTRVVGIVVGGFSPGSFSTGDAARRGARDVTWTLSLSLSLVVAEVMVVVVVCRCCRC